LYHLVELKLSLLDIVLSVKSYLYKTRSLNRLNDC